MIQIGIFEATKEGFSGHIKTLLIDADICLHPATHSDHEHAPDYHVHLGSNVNGPQIGAGWKHVGEKAGAYVALQIDDPLLAIPLRANLFRSKSDDDAHILFWNRPAKREEKS